MIIHCRGLLLLIHNTFYTVYVELLASQIFGDLLYKMQLARFLFGGFEYCMERNPCLQPKWHTFNLAIFT